MIIGSSSLLDDEGFHRGCKETPKMYRDDSKLKLNSSSFLRIIDKLNEDDMSSNKKGKV